jgi:hypothetical protein
MENIEEHPQTMDTSGGKSSIIDPADGRIPYQPWAAARRDEMFSTYVNPLALCTPLISPKQAYGPGTFRVVQTPGSVFMINDFAHTYRIIPTDGRAHVGANIKLYSGDSRGRWDGNTLVIDVANQRDRQWLDAVGNFFSENVHVVERFTLAAAASSTTRSRSTIPPSSRGRGRCGSRCGAGAARKRGSTPASKGTATTPNTFARSASSGSRA